MVQVDILLKEIAGLSAQGLTGAVVALSFSKRLVQPIRDRVHPGFEYWGRQDPTQGQNRNVPRDEAAIRVACMMQGSIRDRGCPKTHCMKQPTSAVSPLDFSMLYYFYFELFCLCSELFCLCLGVVSTLLLRMQGTHWVVINSECFYVCRPKF